MSTYQLRGKRRNLVLWAIIVLLFVAALLVSMMFMSPAPPKKIRLATGGQGGGYDTFGMEYKERLEPLGLKVDVVNSSGAVDGLKTNGSVDNLKLLVEGKVDVAFVQGGTSQLVADPNHKLRGLAAIYLEPLWVFYRSEKPVNSLGEVKDMRISIGAPGSGTEAVSKALLEKHGIDPNGPNVKHFGLADVRKHLLEGAGDDRIDVAMVVSTAKDPRLRELLAEKDVQLLNFRRDVAYARTITEEVDGKSVPYLTPVKLAEGVLDLRDNIPPADTTLLAPSAMLACREDLNPQVVDQVLKVARSIHEKGGLLEPPLKYPTLEGMDLPPDDSAETYMKNGESFLSKTLPYWAVRLLLQMKILLLPVLAVLLPVVKIIPSLYAFYFQRKINNRYAQLREVEGHIAAAKTPEEVHGWLGVLDKLIHEMEEMGRRIPANLQKDVYHWRLHAAHARNQAMERSAHLLEAASAPTGRAAG
jgi:TRAP transporter TAXI family solute receptor